MWDLLRPELHIGCVTSRVDCNFLVVGSFLWFIRYRLPISHHESYQIISMARSIILLETHIVRNNIFHIIGEKMQNNPLMDASSVKIAPLYNCLSRAFLAHCGDDMVISNHTQYRVHRLIMSPSSSTWSILTMRTRNCGHLYFASCTCCILVKLIK